MSRNGGTNTENTTKNTYRDSFNHIKQSGNDVINGQIERTEYIEQIRINIEYDAYMSDDSRFDRELYQELYELICEIACMRNDTVRIGGGAYPYEMVKENF